VYRERVAKVFTYFNIGYFAGGISVFKYLIYIELSILVRLWLRFQQVAPFVMIAIAANIGWKPMPQHASS
jgi:hypothetical protein